MRDETRTLAMGGPTHLPLLPASSPEKEGGGRMMQWLVGSLTVGVSLFLPSSPNYGRLGRNMQEPFQIKSDLVWHGKNEFEPWSSI